MVKGSPVGIKAFKENAKGLWDTGLYDFEGNPMWGIPKNKDMKLTLAKFSAKA